MHCLANKHSAMYQFVIPLKPANFVVVILKVHVPLRKVQFCTLADTVLCKSNDSEFRRISTKFYEILRKSAKFRGERIFGEISLASIVSPLTKFRADVRNFTWQIR